MTQKNKTTDTARKMAANGIYSDLPEINQRIMDIMPALTRAGYHLDDAKPIPYGSRVTLDAPNGKLSLNFYFSKKKGHSTVFDGKVTPAQQEKLRPLLEPGSMASKISPVKNEQKFNTWIGCDEGGKGAYAGPLVAVAFFADQTIVPELVKMGVADSKTIAGKKLIQMAGQLKSRFRDRMGVMELKPETYNRLYDDFKTQGKSLNHLLAWAHGKAVEKLMPKNPEAVVVDQFAYPGVIVPRMPKGPELLIRTKAENNIAVAAASVIAGAWYLGRLEQLSHDIGVKLVAGAGKNADDAVVAAVRKHGPDILKVIVKKHFKNTLKVTQKI